LLADHHAEHGPLKTTRSSQPLTIMSVATTA
jgi:hypothetical protein